MSPIRILDPFTTNQIAAGEVVETPASVVKELVENALDAESSQISISFKKGGLEEIRIIDNGYGIVKSEVELAFQRHATSKIYTADDLLSVKTLGFRGEALPSIAAVSRLECITRSRNDDVGTRILLEGGRAIAKEEVGATVGTEIRVCELFYNTPARRRFLQSIAAEAARLSFLVTKTSLINPAVSFVLANENRKLLDTRGDGDTLMVISQAYGRECARAMLPLSGADDDYSLEGFISNTSWTKTNRRFQTFSVNGRLVKSRLLQEALEEGYRSLLPKGRFPGCVLHLKADPRKIDVNVHPAKTGVRFSNEKELFNFIEDVVRQTLQKRLKFNFFKSRPVSSRATLEEKETEKTSQGIISFEKNESSDRPFYAQVDEKPSLSALEPHTEYSPGGTGVEKSINEQDAEKRADYYDSETPIPPLTIIGQLFQTYILAQTEEELYLIDQHAAHERILYEEYLSYYNQDQAEMLVQDIIPQKIELPVSDTERLTEILDFLHTLGLKIDHFGHNTYIIRSLPFFIKDVFKNEYLLDFLENVLQKPQMPHSLLKEDILIMMACKAAVKAHQYLEKKEAESLVERLRQTRTPFTCPHGRPTILRYSQTEIEKNFKRTGS